MRPEDLNLQAYVRGKKYALALDARGAASGTTLPVLLVRGKRPGKVLVALAGVHGDEYEGVRAILETYAQLEASEMAGDVLAIPVAHPPAFWARQRLNPTDGADLARSMPGDLDSGPTRAIAHCLAHAVLPNADFLLDLHSAGINFLMPTMAGYDAQDPRSRAAALDLGMSVVWGHHEVPPGRTISTAKELGIPWLYTEARGAGRIDPEDLRLFRQALRNLMCHLSILPGKPTTVPPKCHLIGDGNIDASIVADQRGFLIPSVDLLQEVRTGDEVGRIVSLEGEPVQVLRAPSDGVVVLLRQLPVVKRGDKLFLLAQLLGE